MREREKGLEIKKEMDNSPFHIKQKYAWNTHAFQLGYIFAKGNTPFPYILWGQ